MLTGHTHNPLSSAAERRTHNPEVGGSKPPGGSYNSQFYRNCHAVTQQHTFHRHGAEVARRAHNPEVTRSKRVAGIVKLDIKRSIYHRCGAEVSARGS